MLLSVAVLFSSTEAIGNSEQLMEKSAVDNKLINALNNTIEQAQRSALENSEMAVSIKTITGNAEVPKVNIETSYQIGSTLFKMKDIPAGSFAMGSNDYYSEKPIHRVEVNAFKLMETEVTFAMWDTCVAEGGCGYRPEDGEKFGGKGWGRANRPAIQISYDDITKQFIPWLNKTTGETFRLPSEAEWEYAAKADSTSKYSWGDNIDCSKASYGYHSGECGGQKSTVPVKSFDPNAFGLYNMHGNVMELTQDCWNNSYRGAPTNGHAWREGICSRIVARGGSWYPAPFYVRSAYRSNVNYDSRAATAGFRLALDMN